MRPTLAIGAALLLSTFVLVPAVVADDLRAVLAHYRPVALKDGPNSVDLLPDGRPDLVAKAYYENFNTHSFHHLTFYVQRPDATSRIPRWEIVPLVTGERVEFAFRTVKGASCVLRDVRLLKPRAGGKQPAVLLVAERPLGASFEDTLAVTFSLYRLTTTDRTVPGEPGIAYVRSDSLVSRARYCDVEQALARELGL